MRPGALAVQTGAADTAGCSPAGSGTLLATGLNRPGTGGQRPRRNGAPGPVANVEPQLADSNLRPPVWIGHVSLTTDCLADSHAFMVSLGMRPIVKGEDFAVLELRAGTHLILQARDQIEPEMAPFDLMVDDLDATHSRLAKLGLSPSEVSKGRIHRSFTVRDPSGHIITFNSSHVSDQPV